MLILSSSCNLCRSCQRNHFRTSISLRLSWVKEIHLASTVLLDSSKFNQRISLKIIKYYQAISDTIWEDLRSSRDSICSKRSETEPWTLSMLLLLLITATPGLKFLRSRQAQSWFKTCSLRSKRKFSCFSERIWPCSGVPSAAQVTGLRGRLFFYIYKRILSLRRLRIF